MGSKILPFKLHNMNNLILIIIIVVIILSLDVAMFFSINRNSKNIKKNQRNINYNYTAILKQAVKKHKHSKKNELKQ